MRNDPSRNIPKKNSESQTWVQWHKDLKKLFGKKRANSIWIKAWERRGGEDAKANTVSLREYMEGQGVMIDRSSMASMVDFADDVGDFIGGIFGATKWIGIGLAVVLVGGVAMVVFNLAKSPTKSIKALKG